MASSSSYTQPPPTYDDIHTFPKKNSDNEPLLGQNRYSDDPEMGNGISDDDLFYKGPTVSQSSVRVRMEFVRKVYSILAVQLFGTAVVSALFMYNPSAKTWVQQNTWMLILSTVLTLVNLFALIWKRRSTPINFYLLAGFTLLESYSVGTVVTFYDQKIVLQALIITFGVFIGLTLFTLQSKWDFSGLAPFLYSALWILILTSFVQMFFPFSRAIDFCLALGAVVIFCGYILFDTFLIANHLNPEEYILGAVNLYMDVINLFLQILRLLNNMQRD